MHAGPAAAQANEQCFFAETSTSFEFCNIWSNSFAEKSLCGRFH